jgi:hypothetical protein
MMKCHNDLSPLYTSLMSEFESPFYTEQLIRIFYSSLWVWHPHTSPQSPSSCQWVPSSLIPRPISLKWKADLVPTKIPTCLTPWPLVGIPPVFSGMTLPLSGHQTRAVTFGCMAKGRGVSSRASPLISAKILVGNAVSSGHQAKAVSSSSRLVVKMK